MSSYHGWTHRPKELGGTDPIPAVAATPSYYAGRALPYSAFSHTVTTPWTLEEIPTLSASMVTNDSDNLYFEEIQDGAGKNGIRIIQEGVYRWAIAAFLRPTSGGAGTVPPYFAIAALYRTNFGADFDINNIFFASQFANLNPVYVPDSTEVPAGWDTIYVYREIVTELQDLNTGLSNVPIDYAFGAVSWGGTEDWMWGTGSLNILRLGDVAAGFEFQ